ncbi:MAG: hypothetical protein AMJ95_02335 [Omnitrophica WOR_2 bacterium SM23_72]|nr:MAG: hypothetical protein AMJ95_02335 [Omnitrophica WOR_2 bacterium SM23_72]
MSATSYLKSKYVAFSKIKGTLFAILLLVGILSGIFWQIPFREVFDYSKDEGYTLMGASLFLKGFSLYKQIWFDQNPLFTWLLAFWFRLVGPSVYNGRILVLFFSAILLWALYQTVKIEYGRLSAFMAVVFLILSNAYLTTSTSVMIGIPSLAFAMLSVYCLLLYKKIYKNYLLGLSGIFMALSLQIKLFTVFLLPVIFLEFSQIKYTYPHAQKAQTYSPAPFFLWFITFLASYFTITFIFFGFNFQLLFKQLLVPHFRGALMLRHFNFSVIWPILLTDYEIALLALLGIVLLIKQKKWQHLFPVLWLVSAFVILFYHRPIWGYYYPIISIPICWLAAITFGDFFHKDIRRAWFIKNKNSLFDIILRWFTAILLLLVMILIPVKYIRARVAVKGTGKVTPQDKEVVNLLTNYRPFTSWVITDRPILAFYADMLVPPELAVISSKRTFVNETQEDYFIETLKKYEVKIIILDDIEILFDSKMLYGLKVMSYFEENYDRIYQAQSPFVLWWVNWNTSPVNIVKAIYRLWFKGDKEYQSRCLKPITYREIEFYISKDLSSR